MGWPYIDLDLVHESFEEPCEMCGRITSHSPSPNQFVCEDCWREYYEF